MFVFVLVMQSILRGDIFIKMFYLMILVFTFIDKKYLSVK